MQSERGRSKSNGGGGPAGWTSQDLLCQRARGWCWWCACSSKPGRWESVCRCGRCWMVRPLTLHPAIGTPQAGPPVPHGSRRPDGCPSHAPCRTACVPAVACTLPVCLRTPVSPHLMPKALGVLVKSRRPLESSRTGEGWLRWMCVCVSPARPRGARSACRSWEEVEQVYRTPPSLGGKGRRRGPPLQLAWGLQQGSEAATGEHRGGGVHVTSGLWPSHPSTCLEQ